MTTEYIFLRFHGQTVLRPKGDDSFKTSSPLRKQGIAQGNRHKASSLKTICTTKRLSLTAEILYDTNDARDNAEKTSDYLHYTSPPFHDKYRGAAEKYIQLHY